MTETQAPPDDGSRPDDDESSQINRWSPLLTFVLFAIAITATSYLFVQRYKQHIKEDEWGELEGIATLKSEQITQWVYERKNNAQTLVNDPLFLGEVERWLQRGAPADDSRQRLVKRLNLVPNTKASFGYTSITLFDARLRPHLTSTGQTGAIKEHEKSEMLESMRTGQISVSDIHAEMEPGEDEIEIDVVAPMMVGNGASRHAIGVVMLHIDPGRFLFPLVQHWPTDSATSESLLVRRDGDEVVFLNELRHLKNTSLKLRLPLSRKDLPATMAALGMVGRAEGIDYRGVPVISELRQVQGTPWALVTKVDKKEVFAPIDKLSRWILLLMLSLIMASGIFAIAWRKKQLQKLHELQQAHQRELDHKVLSRHLDYLTRYANDIILLVDESGKLIQFNDRALDAYGYTAEEFATLNIFDLREIDFSAQTFDEFRNVTRAGSMRFESVHARKNGELFPVEISVRSTSIGGKLFQQIIIRDISERRRAEEQLENERVRLRTLVQSIPDLVWLKDVNSDYLLCNKRYEDLLGYKAEDIIGRNDHAFMPENQADLSRRDDRQVMVADRPQVHEEWLTFARDGYRGLFETIKTPLRDSHGKLIGVMGIARDITERINAARAIQTLNADLDATLRAIPDLLFELGRDGRYINIWTRNQSLLAAQRERLLGNTVNEMLPPEAAATVMLALGEAERSGYSFGHVIKLDLPQGPCWFELSTSVKPSADAARNRFIMLSRDITERKRYEEELRFKNTLLTTEHETSIDGILLVDEHSKIVQYNRRFAEIWKLSPEALANGMSQQQALQNVLDMVVDPAGFQEKIRELYRQRDRSSRDEIELCDGRVLERYTAPMNGPQQEYYGRITYFRDITELKRAARNLARSYAQLQQLTLRMENARTDERERIALNLHDEMGATLAALKMRVSWLASKLPANTPHLAEEATHINGLITDGIHTMHRIVSQLRPDLLGDEGLVAAITDYVKRFESHTKIECLLRLPSRELALNDDQATTAFRILQECMNNVVKHAQASQVTITFTQRTSSITMTVADNGIGFDTSKPRGHSFGLAGIRERALLIGGKVRITSAPSKGTLITVNIPHIRAPLRQPLSRQRSYPVEPHPTTN